MEKNKNYQNHKDTQRLYRSKKQQETQQKLKQIFNKTQRIINELCNYREKHIQQPSFDDNENPEYVNSFYISKKQLSCVRVVNLVVPSMLKQKSKKCQNKAVQTQYESNKLTQKQENRSLATKCITQYSQNIRSFQDLSTHKNSLSLLGQKSHKSFFPPSKVIVKQICLNCNKSKPNNQKSVTRSKSKGISITSCSPSRRYNVAGLQQRSQQKLKTKFRSHSRQSSNTPRHRISLVKNILNSAHLKKIQL